MGFIEKISDIMSRDVHGKNLGKYIRRVRLDKLAYFDLLQIKRLCPVCSRGSIEVRPRRNMGSCLLCGQSFLIEGEI